MKIQVTERDILTGERFKGSQCPIAKAIRRHRVTKINVGESEISFWKNGSRYGFDTPPVAARFVHDFDRRMNVEPITFEL